MILSPELNFILNLPPRIDDTVLSGQLTDAGVIVHPLLDYYLHPNASQKTRLNGLVMGFACASRADLERSAIILIEQINASGHQV